MKLAVANWTLTAFDGTAVENCEVSPEVRPGRIVLRLVAVAVINELEVTTVASVTEK